MRSLSDTLLEAQKSATAEPYVKVEAVEKVAGVTRFNWERLYQGGEADCFHAATLPGDGSLIRLRVASPGGTLYRQRVTNPDQNSDYSQWTDWGVTSYAVALCSRNAEVLAFRIGISDTDANLYRCESTDNGASWGPWINMGYIGTAPSDYRVACCFKDNGDAIVLFSNGTTIYRRRRINGTWEAAAAWSNALQSITGIAVTHMGDWNVVVTGTMATDKPGVWSCVLGDGYSGAVDTWSPLSELTIASPGSNTEFHAPSLSFPDVFRIFFVEKYTGSEAYSRPYFSHSLASADFISNLWREPTPFNLSSSYGLALNYSGSYVWLTRPDGVWRALLIPASVDVTEDVIEVNSWTEPFSGRVAVTLSNDDGRYNTLGSGTYEAIKKNSELLISFGYRTTAGNEASLGPAYWIEGWEYITKGGQSQFVLYGRDGWSLLDRWRARRQFTWAKGDKNIFQLLAFIFARAGLEFSAFSTSSALVSQYPAFTIHPGESGATAVRRLLDMVPDVIYFLGHCGYGKNPLASDGSAYSYGTDHAILEASYRTEIQPANRAQVFGDGIVTEDWDWDEIQLVYDRLAQASDLNLDAITKAHHRGQAILRQADIESMAGHILVPMNCGQDLYDVIDITWPQAGLDASKRRVLALAHTWAPAKGKYTLRLNLGAP